DQPERSSSLDWELFRAVLDDDFNTAEAVRIMRDWRHARQLDLLTRALKLFGLESLSSAIPGWGQSRAPEEVVELAEKRWEARRQKAFDIADAKRGEILARGWTVEDFVDGYRLHPARREILMGSPPDDVVDLARRQERARLSGDPGEVEALALQIRLRGYVVRQLTGAW